MDFTLQKYQELLLALKCYVSVKVRHNMDLKPQNSFQSPEGMALR